MTANATLFDVDHLADLASDPTRGLAERVRHIRNLAATDTSPANRLALEILNEAQQIYLNATAMIEQANARTQHADAVLHESTARLQQAEAMRHESTSRFHDAERELGRVHAQKSRMDAELKMLRDKNVQLEAQAVLLQERLRRLTKRGVRPTGTVIPDAPSGRHLRPNPAEADSGGELIAILRAYREWAGNPSLRQIAAGSDGQIGATKVYTLLDGDQLPERLEHLDGIVRGCGGTDEDRQAWATAWRILRTKEAMSRVG